MSNIQWDDGAAQFLIDGQALPAVVKGAADAVALETTARLRVLADRLAARAIDVDEWYREMKRETKLLYAAQTALARGGWDKMRPQDWARAEDFTAAQWNGIPGKFPGLRAFADDVRRGRYGDDLSRDNFRGRSQAYADAGRALYENEAATARGEAGHTEGKRVLAASDHCSDCPAWARLGWMPLDELLEKYPIGASACGVYCWCGIVTRPAIIQSKGLIAERADIVPAGTKLQNLSQRVKSELAPMQPHPFSPSGTPVGKLLDLSGDVASLRSALDSLDAVHGDGELDKVFVRAMNEKISKRRSEIGKYIAGVEPSISIHPGGPTPGFSLVHEIGHWLDDKVFGKSDYRSFTDLGNLENSNELAGLKSATEGSEAIKFLRKIMQKSNAKTIRSRELASARQRFTVDYEIDRPYAEYLLKQSEIFARAYAQYIASRSGDAQLQAELASRLYRARTTKIGGQSRNDLHYFEQWDAKDFENIASEFDKLFSSKGWLK